MCCGLMAESGAGALRMAFLTAGSLSDDVCLWSDDVGTMNSCSEHRNLDDEEGTASLRVFVVGLAAMVDE